MNLNKYDVVDKFWNYFVELKVKYGTIENMPKLELQQLYNKFKVMHYFLEKKYEIDEIHSNTLLRMMQAQRIIIKKSKSKFQVKK